MKHLIEPVVSWGVIDSKHVDCFSFVAVMMSSLHFFLSKHVSGLTLCPMGEGF